MEIIARKGLPAIKVKLAQKNTLALLDSASGLNLIKKDVFDKYFAINKAHLPKSDVKVKGVNGIISRASGEIDLKLEIMNKEFTFLFIIIDDAQFPTDVLLGYNALREGNLVTDWQKCQVWFSETSCHTNQCHSFQPLVHVIGLDGVPKDTGVPENECGGLQGVNVVLLDDDNVDKSEKCRLQDTSMLYHCLHNTLGVESAPGATPTQSTDHLDAQVMGKDPMTKEQISGNLDTDSFVCFEDLDEVNTYVKKPLVVEPNCLVMVDFSCPTMETEDQVCLALLSESCRIKDLALDNTIVNLVNGSGFCYVKNMTDFVKNIESDVFFTKAVRITHDFAYVDLISPEGGEQ